MSCAAESDPRVCASPPTYERSRGATDPFSQTTKEHESSFTLDSKEPASAIDPHDTEESPAEDGWQLCVQTMKTYDTKMIADWKEELNALLLFAGLLSAIATGFTVDQYGGQKTNDNIGQRSVELLQQISMQLSSLKISADFINSTVPAAPNADPREPPGSTPNANLNVWTIMLSSLIIALIAAMLSLFVLQWLRAYQDLPANLSYRERACVRQKRFQAIRAWRIPFIVASIHALLQLSVGTLLLAVVALAATNGCTLLAVISAVAWVAIVLVATVAASLAADCPYRSVLSWYLRAFIWGVGHMVLSTCCGLLYFVLGKNHPNSPVYAKLQHWRQQTRARYAAEHWTAHDLIGGITSQDRTGAVAWTVQHLDWQLLRADKAKLLVASLLEEHVDLVEDTIHWFSSIFSIPKNAIRRCATDLETLPAHMLSKISWRLRLGKMHKSVTLGLFQCAAARLESKQYKATTVDTSEDTIKFLSLMKAFALELDEDPELTPLLWCALARNQNQSSHRNRVELFNHHIVSFYGTSFNTKICEHQIRGIPFLCKYISEIANPAVMNVVGSYRVDSTIGADFERVGMIACKTLILCGSKLTADQIEQFCQPVLDALRAYLSFHSPVEKSMVTEWASWSNQALHYVAPLRNTSTGLNLMDMVSTFVTLYMQAAQHAWPDQFWETVYRNYPRLRPFITRTTDETLPPSKPGSHRDSQGAPISETSPHDSPMDARMLKGNHGAASLSSRNVGLIATSDVSPSNSSTSQSPHADQHAFAVEKPLGAEDSARLSYPGLRQRSQVDVTSSEWQLSPTGGPSTSLSSSWEVSRV